MVLAMISLCLMELIKISATLRASNGKNWPIASLALVLIKFYWLKKPPALMLIFVIVFLIRMVVKLSNAAMAHVALYALYLTKAYLRRIPCALR